MGIKKRPGKEPVVKEDIERDTKTALLVEGQRKFQEEADLSRVIGREDADDLSRVIGREDADDLQSKELTPYLDGQTYDRARVMSEIKIYMNQTVEGIIETGRRLICLKVKEKGNFYKCLDDLGVAPMTAWRFMAVAKKISNLSRVKHLNLLDMKKGIGKLYAFLDIPDDELKEFEESGELRGLRMEEIDALPVKELKERLRKREKDVEQGVLQLQEAGRKIESLERELNAVKNPIPYTSEEQRQLDFLMGIRMKFDMLITETMTIERTRGNERSLQNLYFLYAWISWVSSDEMMKMRAVYDGFLEVPWETDEGEIPALFKDIGDVMAKAAIKQAERAKAKQ
jgi:hypothetical protein